MSKVDAYIATVNEQSAAINTSLMEEELTQDEMNAKSKELLVLWEDAMNYVLGELKNNKSADEFAAVENEQTTWTADKDAAVKAAGQEFEGGSMYALVVNLTDAEMTEAHVYELNDLLK